MNPRRAYESRKLRDGTCCRCGRLPVRWNGSTLCWRCGAAQSERMNRRYRAGRKPTALAVKRARTKRIVREAEALARAVAQDGEYAAALNELCAAVGIGAA